MTASSVELFPCQVQFMGLPRSANSASSAATGSSNLRNLNVGLNPRPPIQKVQRVSRNLFGAPDPTEMKNLYQQEAERQRKYVLGRYNFDTKPSTDVNEVNRTGNDTNEHDDINYTNRSFKHPTAFPNLIEQELKQHDQHQQCKKQSFCRTSLEETPSNRKICNHANHISEVTRRGCELLKSLSPAVDHQKPYTRQSLLTERFNIRKSKLCLSRSTKCYSVGVIKTNSLEERNAFSNKHEEHTKSICKKACVESDKDNNSALVFKNKHTAVSLQLVVSTQNLS